MRNIRKEEKTMANIFTNKDNKATFTATANCFFVNAMRKSAIELASKHNCAMTEVTVKVDGNDTKRYRFTAKTKADRDAFVTAFERAYAKATKTADKTKTEKKVAPARKAEPSKGKGKPAPVPAPAKETAPKTLTKAEKKAIRSECYALAKGDVKKYDKLCKARGVDNGRA